MHLASRSPMAGVRAYDEHVQLAPRTRRQLPESMSRRRAARVVLRVALLLLASSSCLVALVACQGKVDGATRQATAALARPRLVKVTSTVMEPTLHCSGQIGCGARVADRVEFVSPPRPPRRREILVIKPPAGHDRKCPRQLILERAIGLPGDRWQERRGFVFIDGHRLAEFYIRNGRRDSRTVAPIRIPRDRYFVMGDNRRTSCDSRAWGPIPASRIVGVFLALRRPHS